MEKFEYQVEKEKLERPACIRTFRKNGFGGDESKKIKPVKEYLNNLHATFAVEESDSVIEIFTEDAFLDQ